MGFATVCGMLVLAMAASGAPSPLYSVYQADWGFSTFVLTLIYAVYPVGVLAALLLVGRISDDVGRRRVLMAGLAGLLASTLMFLMAATVHWLVAARAVQGVATGVLLGAVSAAMLDLRAARSGEAVGVINGALTTVGIGFGALGAALLVHYAPWPLLAPFIVLLIAEVMLIALALALPETVVAARPVRLRPEVPRVPVGIRAHFGLAALGVLASWSVMGLFLALGPSMAGELTASASPVAGGAVIAVVIGSGGLAQFLVRRHDSQRVTVVGAATLALGMAANAVSLSWESLWPFYVTAGLTGIGFGMSFFGALRSLTGVVPSRSRAEVMSAFYVVAYVASSLPAVAAGLVVTQFDLTQTFQAFAVGVVLISVGVAVMGRRVRLSSKATTGLSVG